MEDLTSKISINDPKLRKLFTVYGIASVLFLVILVAGMVLRDYAKSYDDTVQNLERIRAGLVRIEAATRDIKNSIVIVEKTIPPSIFAQSPERQLLSGLDNLKSDMRSASIHVAEIGMQDNNVVLPVTIRGFLTDYSLFVNDIGKLQAMSFPFVRIVGIEIKRDEAGLQRDSRPAGQQSSDQVVYEITGELLTLAGDPGPAPGKPEAKPDRPKLFREGGT